MSIPGLPPWAWPDPQPAPPGPPPGTPAIDPPLIQGRGDGSAVVFPMNFPGGWGQGYNVPGGWDDATQINAALQQFTAVRMAPVVYSTLSPLVIPQGGRLLGSLPVTQSGDGASLDLGTVIKPAAGFSPGGLLSAAVLFHAPSTQRQAAVRDLWVDGSAAPAGVHGLGCDGVFNAVSVLNCGVFAAPGDGLHLGSSADGWNIDTLILQACGGSGVSGAIPDFTMRNVHAQSCGSYGFIISGGGNSRLVQCRADLNAQDGFRFDVPSGSQAGGFLDAVTLTGCGSQRNQGYGCNIINGSATGQNTRAPVIMNGCAWDGDGVNQSASSAGWRAAGAVLVVANDCMTLVHTEDVAGGCPNFGFRTDQLGTGPGKPVAVILNGGFLNCVNATAYYSDVAPAAVRSITGVYGLFGAQWNGGAVAAVT